VRRFAIKRAHNCLDYLILLEAYDRTALVDVLTGHQQSLPIRKRRSQWPARRQALSAANCAVLSIQHFTSPDFS
jgi:hypothetical protein